MKTKTIEKTRIEEIRERHGRIGGYLRTTLDEGIRIGELLTAQKAELKHGEWLSWVKEYLPFSERLAQDYVRFYDRREELKSASVADLREARKLLAGPEEQAEAKKTTARKKKKKATPVDSKVLQDIIGLYQELYLEMMGIKAFVGGVQYSIVRNLLRQQDEVDIMDKLRLYFSVDFWFVENSNYSLKNFIAHYNEITGSIGGIVSMGSGEIKSDAKYTAAKKILHKFWAALKNTEMLHGFVQTLLAMEKYRQDGKHGGELFTLDDTATWADDAGLLRYLGTAISKIVEECQLEKVAGSGDIIRPAGKVVSVSKGNGEFTVEDIEADADYQKAKTILDGYFKPHEIDPKVLITKNRFSELVGLLLDETFDFEAFCKWYDQEIYAIEGFGFGLFLYPNIIERFKSEYERKGQYLRTSPEVMSESRKKGLAETNEFIKKISEKMDKEEREAKKLGITVKEYAEQENIHADRLTPEKKIKNEKKARETRHKIIERERQRKR